MKNKLWILFLLTIIFFLSHFHIHKNIKREAKNEVILKRLENLKGGKLGADGKAVHFVPVKKEIQNLQNDIIAKFTIDHVLSDRIGLHRKVSEHRHPQCLTKIYSKIFKQSKKASIIFNVFNEAWSTLIRSVFSILHTAPLSLVEEIILIDDNSDFSFLGERLDQKIINFSIPIRLTRLKERAGLIKGRNIGASLAKGEILVFLDCHIECNDGWLEPLVAQIVENPTSIAVPVIAVIDRLTFEFSHDPFSFPQLGSFDKTLNFNWFSIPDEDRSRDRTESLRSPTMAGGLYAIDKNWFHHLGGYDDGMDIWGVENVEMSVRTWTCGGSIRIAPCSIIGHVFPEKSFYRRDPTRNLARFAEVWLDDYKSKLYRRTSFAIPYSFKNSSSLQKRKELRQNLQCRSFRWFLDEIFPQFIEPEDKIGQFGFLHSPNLEWCLAISAAGEIIWEQCRFQSYGNRPLEQLWELDSNGQLKSFGQNDKLKDTELKF
ncbi:unnamed protein product [Oikopleura dioica]|uniref:Glycosyltransferase 2-like domain-containing protein n=1 Tax=Oikopleura dioica TaxID=34765 RepID=E4X5U9_OIKDI|nr:unnamed protein product [Oikopleura dioica]